MGRQRVFIGLPAGDGLREAAAGFRHCHTELKVRWIRPENLHVTLVPPWEMQDPEPVCRVLAGIASATPAVQVRFDQVSAGPDPRRPRLLWATGSAPEGLRTLAARLAGTFCDGREAQRCFLLHLTVARLDRQAGRSGPVMELCESVGWDALLDTLCLYESILKPTGAEYRALYRFSLSSGL